MDDSFVGRRFGPYELRAPLGAGGMARVYRAFDQQLHREVALKLLADSAQHIPDVAERFLHEARTLASLQHPGIVHIYTVGEYEGIPYLVQELLPGPTLADELTALQQQETYMAPEEVCRVIGQLASALDYAHSRGIVHRDLKPSNCLRNDRGELVLVDFGIAKAITSTEKLTQTGLVMGTPHYLAPEQAMGQSLTPAADIYALGVMIFELLTNQLPFDESSALAIALAHLNQPPPAVRTVRPDLPPAVEAVVHKALAKAPEERYASAGALAGALAAAWRLPAGAGHEAQTTVNPGLPARAQRAPHDAQTTVNTALSGASPPPNRAHAAPGAGPSARRSGRRWIAVGLIGLVLLLGFLALRTGDPPSAAGTASQPRSAGEQPPAPEPTAAALRAEDAQAQEQAPPVEQQAPPPQDSVQPTAAPPDSAPPSGAPSSPAEIISQVSALLDQAAGSGQAEPKTAEDLQKKLEDLDKKLEEGDLEKVQKKAVELQRKIDEEAGKGKLAPEVASQLQAMLQPLR